MKLRSRGCANFIVLSIALLVGCGGNRAVEDRDHAPINAIATAYRSYAQVHGTPPPNELEFRKFIESLPDEQRQALHGGDLEGMFVSPRDKQPYVVSYGETAKGRIPHYFIYERTGVDGKQWAASSMGYVSEVSQTEINEKTGGKP